MNAIKIAAAITLIVQIGLIGLSVLVISGGFGEPKPIIVAFNAVIIAVNLLFGAMNVRLVCR